MHFMHTRLGRDDIFFFKILGASFALHGLLILGILV